MKTSGGITIFRLMISFLLVAITASSGVVVGENEVVLDSSGKPVKANVPYYVKFWKPEERAWISRYGNRYLAPFSCPQRVVLFSTAIVETPPPVIFVVSSDVVRVSTELNIRFARRGLFCRESGFWRVADSSLPIKEVVLTGSKSSNDSTFTIKKSDGSYKFAFGSADKPTDIGLDGIGPGISRLILSSNSSFGVSFVPE